MNALVLKYDNGVKTTKDSNTKGSVSIMLYMMCECCDGVGVGAIILKGDG